MTITVSVRLATPADADDIAAISRDYIEHGFDWRWTEDRVQKEIDNPQTNVAVVGSLGSVVAFGIMAYSDEDAHLLLMGVRRSSQRKGVGSAILSWLEEVAVNWGAARRLVEARVSNAAAQSFYAAHGYHALRIEKAMYREVEDGLRFQKWLRDA